MCCGRARPISSGQLQRPARGGTEFEYLGRTSLTVTGPASGVVYRFATPGARQHVDQRDALSLQKVPVLRPVGRY
jgi:hypothetical protein